MEFLGDVGPEGLGIFDGLLVEGLVFGEAFNVRLGGEVRGRRKNAVLTEDGFEIGIEGSGRCRHGFTFPC